MEEVSYDYTYDELRSVIRWDLEKRGATPEMVTAVQEAMNDEVIEYLEVSQAHAKDDFQLQVNQYREAKRRNQTE